jgi:hypothetical protein
MGAALAIRQLAGAKMIEFEITEYAWMVCARRQDLDDCVTRCSMWLSDLRRDAEREFLVAIGEVRKRVHEKKLAA